MEQVDSKITTESKENAPKKNRKVIAIVISLIVAIALVGGGIYLYVNNYKIPHDAAVVSYNNALSQYNAAVAALEVRNQELDDSIKALGDVVYAENLPIDDLLLADADSVLEEARSITKDTAAALPAIPKKTEEINAEAERILGIIPEIEAMGDYSDTVEELSATEEKYQTMIDQFQGCKTEVLWTGVDEESTVLRFVVKLSNENAYTMRNVTTEWIAYDKNDAIVGSHDAVQSDIPANGCIYYVGGAGSANLSGTPARVEMKVTTDGILTNRELPQITVSNVQLVDQGWGGFDVTADCVTDSDILTANLIGQIIVKDAEGQTIEAQFWRADNLPDEIAANGKFTLSEYIYDLPTIPTDAEVYVYYTWQ